MDTISSRYFVIGVKNKNQAGWSGIGVLVVGFSQIRAVKNHSLLVFKVKYYQVQEQTPI